jgi:hypothetical protein
MVFVIVDGYPPSAEPPHRRAERELDDAKHG